MTDDARLFAPSAARNRDPILDVLRRHLPPAGTVLEVASGSGEHVLHFAGALPGLTWQPTDPLPDRRASIDTWAAGLANVAPALPLDATAADWPIQHADVVLCINMIHIAPWAAAEGLVGGAARILPTGGLLGPIRPIPPRRPAHGTRQRGVRCRSAQPQPGMGAARVGGGVIPRGRGWFWAAHHQGDAGQQSSGALPPRLAERPRLP